MIRTTKTTGFTITCKTRKRPRESENLNLFLIHLLIKGDKLIAVDQHHAVVQSQRKCQLDPAKSSTEINHHSSISQPSTLTSSIQGFGSVYNVRSDKI